MKKCLVICSGGLDSTTMSLIKREEGNVVDLITFDYGQKASNEIKQSKKLAEKIYAKHIIIDISSLKFIFGDKNQLTNDNIEVENTFKGSVVVPLRNSVFVNLAYIYAMTHQYDEVILGSHLDDLTLDENNEYMFPDCSPQFFTAMNQAYEKGKRKEDHKTEIISASMLNFYKKNLIQKAYEINKYILFESWSCYLNEEVQCGICDSCKNRKNSFIQADIQDETIYKN
jgi:7-cyano-7-deazaguanine synthase